MTSHSWYD